ncbi:thiamine-phosphate kinase [Kinneretia asaccharophila]|uniref:Thiamine-monophosphate kinase n=1 Tax=Roseateles asaccharophilus TaxID=582607 RepID=A0A4R6NBD1_9BURK|nr:thiamine-phosphate kinase [Roseateles asaccharophilus]MDN3543202.1 thiamine-phosphate kinase [Roseateles asaccharophilus]TDP13099.1 thiamine-monophosphate kinase [Roseateles asaccharophilus]
MGEFDLIKRFFTRDTRAPQPGVALGIGDDCAVLGPTPGAQWLVSTDMLVEGRHFLSTVAPERLGHKALAVNLSDLAACGATPRAFTLALALPRADEVFLEGLARGLFALADAHGIALVGGDTTAGPLNLCITVMGEAPAGQALLRSGARAGDDLYVSGSLGDARLALEAFRGSVSLSAQDFETARRAMECPQPRVALGQALRGLAHSAIDVSDGFVGDLGHVLARSGLGATVQADALPRGAALAHQPLALQRLCTLSGGDDYELIFSAPPAARAAVQAASAASATPVTRVGRLEAEPGLRLLDAQGQALDWAVASFDHFKS